ncbi:MAG: 16S rRNA (guanine(966)-N(2))-methyltransferase RsmD [Actinomycetota bacterium]
MRVIAGLAKGRNLVSPSGATRPTSDRAREALFSTLESEFGSMNDLSLLDLYCGSGAVGVEALSRGASLVTSVDNEEKATGVARQNFQLIENITGVGTYSVITMSVGKFLERPGDIQYDIIFLDPPYDLPNNEIEKNLSALIRNSHLKPSSVIAIERDSKARPLAWPEGLKEVKVRKYGAATIYYAEPA